MKIICSGCGAKHWLSDMQLTNGGCNVVCPHCSATNFVDASMVDPQSLEPRWYYAVNEDTVGPLSTRDLEFSFQNGQLTLDSYVWCEGMSDWMALGAVAELDHLLSPVQGSPAGGEATQIASGAGMGGYAQFPAGANLGNGEETAAIDLNEFNKAASNYSPFDSNRASGGIVGMDGQDAQDDEPSFSLGGQSESNAANDMVDARSESSVLFSLSSLQAVSAGPMASPSTPSTAGGGAGLIDVKALASSTPAPRRRTNDVIDSFGGNSAPMSTVLPLGTKKDNTMIYVGAGIAGVVLIALAIIIIMLASGNNNNAQQQQSSAVNTNAKLDDNNDQLALDVAKKKAAEEEAAKKAEEEAAAKKAEEEAAAKKAEEEAAAKKAEEEAAKKAEEEAAKKAEDSKDDSKKADTKKADTKKAADTKPAETKPAETKPADTKKADTKKADTKKADAKPAETKPAADAGGLTKAEIQTTLRGAGAQLRTCSRTSTTKGTMKISFTIKGNGSVSGAKCTSPEFANTPTAACVIKVINGLKFRAAGTDTPISNYPVAVQ